MLWVNRPNIYWRNLEKPESFTSDKGIIPPYLPTLLTCVGLLANYMPENSLKTQDQVTNIANKAQLQ